MKKNKAIDVFNLTNEINEKTELAATFSYHGFIKMIGVTVGKDKDENYNDWIYSEVGFKEDEPEDINRVINDLKRILNDYQVINDLKRILNDYQVKDSSIPVQWIETDLMSYRSGEDGITSIHLHLDENTSDRQVYRVEYEDDKDLYVGAKKTDWKVGPPDVSHETE